MPSVRVLEPHLINQIASGQVVDRPASVVKELVENALDAGATQIDVALQDGGQSLISILDNGQGMRLEDLELCVERHATSKLPDSDLFRIQTFGFRGEALPSIGAVARLQLTSRHASFPPGEAWCLRVEGGIKAPLAPGVFPYPSGTKVEVRDLFFATPARLKFMKSQTTELSHAQDILQRLAFANPKVGFKLTEGSRKLFDYPSLPGLSEQEALLKRAEAVLGTTFLESSLPIAVARETYALGGLMGVPTYHRGTANQQYVFVNGRVVRDRWIGSLIRSAYQDLVPKERHAVGVLFLTLPLEEVDMNVHPAKTEVRFRDLSQIRALVLTALKQALQETGQRPNQELADQTLEAFSAVGEAGNAFASRPSASYTYSHAASSPAYLRESPASFWDKPHPKPSPPSFEASEAFMDLQQPQTTLEGFQENPLGDAIGQIHQSYIVSQTTEALVLVDQHAAHERLSYEKMKHQLAQGAVVRKALLIPEIVALPPLAVAALQKQVESLAKFGLILEMFGEDGVLIREVPDILSLESLTSLIRDLAAELEVLETPEIAPEKLQILLQDVMASIACRSSIKAGKALNKPEMNALLRQMEATPHSGQCNHGRPTFIRLSLKDLERLFGRHD
ncbi:MAG: DNA mismatch repair endonuclease MutL [Alphaproteobacteria bacterium]